jgi:hypothetical protein
MATTRFSPEEMDKKIDLLLNDETYRLGSDVSDLNRTIIVQRIQQMENNRYITPPNPNITYRSAIDRTKRLPPQLGGRKSRRRKSRRTKRNRKTRRV